MRRTPGAGILEAHRLHRAKPQSVAPAPRDLLDRQASFEVIQLLPLALLDRLRRDQSIVKSVVLLPGHRTIDVIGRTLLIARREIDFLHVDGLCFDDGTDGIIKK